MTNTEYNDYYRLPASERRFLPIRSFSPERFAGRCSVASEVYSFAYVMFEISTRGRPAHPLDFLASLDECREYIQNSKPDVPLIYMAHFEERHIQKLIFIFEECWEIDPSNRPTFSYLSTEIRSLYNYIGQNMDQMPELNFDIIQIESEYRFDSDPSYHQQVHR
mgnify:CR=1 FL=1